MATTTAPEFEESLGARIREAAAAGTALEVVGGGSKRFLGRTPDGLPLEIGAHRGIVGYEPTDRRSAAPAGRPPAGVGAALAAAGRMVPFEPPALGPHAPIGGTVACGRSGPRRPWSGPLRDFVLGVRVINGRGEALSFGGQVMKNVAGYDLSRLMAGSMGTLAVLLEVSFKVLPRAAVETTLVFELDAAAAIAEVSRWCATPLPLAGACHDGQVLRLRLAGTAGGVTGAAARLGGEPDDAGDRFWSALREQQLDFFSGERALWRLSVPPVTPMLELDGPWLIDWGGALRWLRSDADGDTIRAAAAAAGGHATLYRHGDRDAEIMHPLAPVALRIHRRVKQAFDPAGIFNRGRMYRDL